METNTKPSAGSWLQSRTGLVLLAFLAIAFFYLVTEHTAHLFGVLPFLLLPLCLALHFFMHGSHDGHGGRKDQSAQTHGQEGQWAEGGKQ